MMKKLSENEWQPFSLKDIFNSFERGKVSSATDEPKQKNGIPYVGATDKNNGVLDFLRPDIKKEQKPNCITFIRDGQGSVGSSIYRKTPFIATVNTSSGYANWLNEQTGLFVSTASNMNRSKYGFGYKRKEERLKSERVMLPAKNTTEPDYDYMSKYISSHCKTKLAKYNDFAKKQLSTIEYKDISDIAEKKWLPFSITDIFQPIRGREGNMAMLENGNVPLISAKKNSNGLKGFVNTSGAIMRGNCISLNNDGDGGAGLSYYQPHSMALDTHVTALVPIIDEMNKFSLLFISNCLSGLHDFFGHGLSISNKRVSKIKIMLPINKNNEPDFEYMEQYVKNIMIKKYKQYLAFLDAKERIDNME